MKLSTIVQTAFVVIITSWMLWLTSATFNQPTVAYVHSEYLFDNYLGTIDSYKTLEAKNQKWGNNLDSLSQTYRATFASYQEGGDKISTEDKAALGSQLQQQEMAFKSYHQSVEKMKLAEDQKLTQAVIKQIDAYLKEYALANGYDLIIGAGEGSSSLVYGKESYNITEEALAFINKKYRGE